VLTKVIFYSAYLSILRQAFPLLYGRQNAIGISGRVGKESDTCYSFWIGATLKLLGAFDYSSIMTTKEFIEECESDVFGGFSKVPDAFPDVLHSFYSVAWSALAGLGGVRPLNCALAICADRV
jgi:geranylgeranyl transferase type-1 subunit beta